MIIKQTFTISRSDGKSILLDVTFNPSRATAPLLLFVHGFKGFKDWGTHNLVAEFFAERGFRFAKFNFSHNGTTPENPVDFVDLGAFGENTFTKEFEDLDLVLKFITTEKDFPQVEQIHLMGHSRGGGTSIIQAANDKRISKLITLASVSDFSNLWKKEQVDEWRNKGVIYSFNTRTGQNTPLKIDLLNDLEKHHRSYDILLAAERVKQPWLIIHGDQDTSVPLDSAYELKERAPAAELFIVPDADHVFGASHPYTQEELPDPYKKVCKKILEFLS